jgi:hypothetical protein
MLPGIDVRAAGGYVVVPPSVHPSGVEYEWDVALKGSAIAEAPPWLLSLLESNASPGESRSADWHQTVSAPVPKGQRNQALARLAGMLFRRLPADVAAELAFCWAQAKLRPPLPEREVLRTIDSIAACELRRRGGRA